MKKLTPAGTTTFLGQSFEKDPTGKTTKYLFAGSQRLAAKDSDGALRFYHTDHLGSSNVVTDGTGALVELAEYTPYGSLNRHEGSANVAQKFTGQRFDNETGLYFYNARYYDPSIGRFISPDPFVQAPTDPQTLNRYSYARNNPLKYTDPTGHFFNFLVALIISIVVSIAVEAVIRVANLSGTAANVLRAVGVGVSAFTGGIVAGITPTALKVATAAAVGSSLALDSGEGRRVVGSIAKGLEHFGLSHRVAVVVASVAANIVVRTSLELSIPTLMGKGDLKLGREVNPKDSQDVATRDDIFKNGETYNFKDPKGEILNQRFVVDDSGHEIGVFGHNAATPPILGQEGIHFDLVVKKDLAGIIGIQTQSPTPLDGYVVSSQISHQRVSMTMLEAGYRTNAFLLGGANWSTLVSTPVAGIYGGGLYNSVYEGTSASQRK